jgi:cold shock CspA family protein
MQGRIIRWNDERGFGFISSKDCNGDVFAHISQFKKGYRRPKVGELVVFEVVLEKGKQSAKSISLVGVKPEVSGVSRFKFILIGSAILIGIAFGLSGLFSSPTLSPALPVVVQPEIKPDSTPVYEQMGFSCEGKTHCSQMTSCGEAKYYLANCPNVKIDGDDDKVPCERQHCGGF